MDRPQRLIHSVESQGIWVPLLFDFPVPDCSSISLELDRFFFFKLNKKRVTGKDLSVTSL